MTLRLRLWSTRSRHALLTVLVSACLAPMPLGAQPEPADVAPLTTPMSEQELTNALARELPTFRVQDTLATRVSISVRDSTVRDIVQAVRQAGLQTAVEVRGVPAERITLGVREVPAEAVLNAVALLSQSRVCVLSDHVLIAPPALISRDERDYAQHHWDYQRDLFLRAIVTEVAHSRQSQLQLRALSPLAQRVCQRLVDHHRATTGESPLLLPPDTPLLCKTLPEPPGGAAAVAPPAITAPAEAIELTIGPAPGSTAAVTYSISYPVP